MEVVAVQIEAILTPLSVFFSINYRLQWKPISILLSKIHVVKHEDF